MIDHWQHGKLAFDFFRTTRIVCRDETPRDQGIVNESFEDRHKRVLVVSQHLHRYLATLLVASMNTADFHGIREHTRQSEWNAFGELVTMHRHFEAITLEGQPVISHCQFPEIKADSQSRYGQSCP